MPESRARANPYSALERYPLEVREVPTVVSRPALLPWWLSPLALVLVGAIEGYRRLVPDRVKRRCIYTPTCSRYGLESVKRYGGVVGALRAWARIKRCNGALYRGGQDLP